MEMYLKCLSDFENDDAVILIKLLINESAAL